MSPLHKAIIPVIVTLLSLSVAEAQIVVNSLDDDGGPGDCELREAIINAINDDQSGSTDCAAGSGADLVDLTGISGEIVLESGQLIIETELTIEGPGADLLAINGNDLSRVLIVAPRADVLLIGLTITGGNDFGGGGIENRGELMVLGCRIIGNQANFGGGIWNKGDVAPADPDNGVLIIHDSEISNNTAFSRGGGLSNDSLGTVTIRRSTFSGNAGPLAAEFTIATR